ncbi:YerC/YecD family TrpR-related protein [Domibacillus sp. DTU_2020_1001157_1_SI_ALB_TIR_016]|uniref:YerC/YecD family TrpR-related protein n=1 Tax=Domibacillus sp. DTU_2020_1001157_1_SI_ALB_TIR_016 TaxID=3077789 RepID=UPI0028EF0E01|nr:YerC/YecD family TrpR-related protein [Domibacillus sp. DTU_2020_1001157_1_SI_ALB_TIR_016]WNS78555.1 YerC/YecD family TrpR-related protein [Domibacillus sp. DTU_2020_1001157_1_SI_ALB_TIR_016]
MYIKKLPEKNVQQLFNAILSLQTHEECRAFFDDLCTMNELAAFTQRLEVARLLQEGCTYDFIQTETKAASGTISRIKKLMDYGNDGYRIALDRIESYEKR